MRGNEEIPGIRWARLGARNDDRGNFREVWRASASAAGSAREGGADQGVLAQANLSHSKAGVLRGLHFHRSQTDHWIVVNGEIFVALVDLRRDDGSVRVATRTLLTDDTLTIPALVAHGFLALRPATLLYLVTREYDGTDEYGLAWNDPELRIPWPQAPTAAGLPILSERDRSNPSLADVRREMAVRPSSSA